MSTVKLYVYDLSNGLARQLSRQLTGKQIDGIWHTSVVVYGKEIFYGQGISITAPGQSHHGRPLQVIDVGETAIDEPTFQEFLDDMREHYTADKYHLLEFNCNSFTNDCVGLLTGGSIPDWIKDLPSDFLSTPFGAALRPTIDAMFRRPVSGAPPPTAPPVPAIQPRAAATAAAASPNPDLAATLLQAVASQAFSSQSGVAATNGRASTPSTITTTAPIHIATNPASFHNVLKTHRAVVAMFTSQTCPPCRMIEPVFERIAHERTQSADVGGGGGIAFVKVDLGAGMANTVAAEYGVRVTPTFLFFRDGDKTGEMKGANASEFESQVNLLIWETYPPHPHTQKSIPALDTVSTNPILFTQVPALDTVLSKLISFIDKSALQTTSAQTVKQRLTSEVVPWLKTRFPAAQQSKATKPPPSNQLLIHWTETTRELVTALPPGELFPLVDMWRLALLDDTVAAYCASNSGSTSDPVQLLLVQGLANISQPTPARNYTLTLLRLLSNTFASPTLGSSVLKRKPLTTILVHNLLHEDAAVRTAAASLGFNVAAFIQKERLEAVRQRYGPFAKSEEDGDWEVEIVSAVLEAIGNEKQSEEIVHRLVACLAFLLRFSPVYEMQVGPLLEVLQAKETLKSKLDSTGFSPNGVKGPALRKLITQVADGLC
ncbi:PPPDE putative peptidase domain-containing protein [Irpex rosettiformis]|uniref:PPPDE putative peptidase domain-containing protein n=1 Tax=Irpex rosettiformis TaxID=378272 RepID=A0ACB8U0M8_9APHY|nr:PPPDE putative peptidase domain-containing protein [Irpex rosettiformis]